MAEPLPHVQKIPGLNELRAIAATVVLIGHTYEIAGHYGVEWARNIYGTYLFGDDMVNLFFVISGFIISLLLMKEKEHATINIGKFYFKRLLRIWPLYFGVLFLVIGLEMTTSFFDSYNKLNGQSIAAVSLFLVNFNDFFKLPLSVIHHYWSLSVEEQFYLFWPFLVRFLKVEWFAISCLFIIGILVFSRNLCSLLSSVDGDFFGLCNNVLYQTRFSVMAIGGLGAIVYLYYQSYIAFILSNKLLRRIFLALFAATFFFKVYIPYINFELKGFLYIIVILILSTEQNVKMHWWRKVLDHLGKISFGLYIYHYPIIPILLYCALKFKIFNILCSLYLLPLVVVSFLVTYFISYISFYYYESFFLKYKPK